MTNDSQSLSHTKWNCKYHIVFAPKYRRLVICGKIKADIGKILRQLCEAKKVEIIEAEACPIHMLVSIPPYLSVAQFVGYLKGKSSLNDQAVQNGISQISIASDGQIDISAVDFEKVQILKNERSKASV